MSAVAAAVLLLASCGAAGADNLQWVVLDSQKWLGVPGVPTAAPASHRAADPLQVTSSCNCNQAGCACSSNLHCASTGLCYQCNQYDCSNRPAGCSCGTGRYCASTGLCETSCNCASGWVCGPNRQCQHPSTCSSLQCSGYGTPTWTGTACTCSCNIGYTGSGCSQCSLSYTGYPFCRSEANCNGQSCGSRGSPYWQGSICSCVCQPGYGGPTCTACQAGYTGYPFCTASGSSQACSGTTCSQRGTAVWSVSSNACICSCNAQYSGARCDTCAAGYTGYPVCVAVGTGGGAAACTSSFCNSKGVAYWDGRECRCTCGEGFGGAACHVCLPGRHDYPRCTLGSSPGGIAITVGPAPTQVRQVDGTYNVSDDELPAGIIAVIVLVAVALVAAGVAAVVLTRRKGDGGGSAKEVHADPDGLDTRAYPAAANYRQPGGVPAPPPKLAGAPERANPISSVFSPTGHPVV